MRRVSHCAGSPSQRGHEGQISVLTAGRACANEEHMMSPDHWLSSAPFLIRPRRGEGIWPCGETPQVSTEEEDSSFTWLPMKWFTHRRHHLFFEAPVQFYMSARGATSPTPLAP